MSKLLTARESGPSARSHDVVAPVLLAVEVDDLIEPDAGPKLARRHALLVSARCGSEKGADSGQYFICPDCAVKFGYRW